MEYCNGVKHLRVATAEIIFNEPPSGKNRIPEISSIRSIEYHGNTQMVIRKASGVGSGLVVPSAQLTIPKNVRLVESFEPSTDTDRIRPVTKRGDDHRYRSFFFCPDDSCIESFHDEDQLNSHITSGTHSTKQSKTSSNDTARVLLFEK